MTSSTIYNDFLPILHIRIEIIHGSHMYILFLPRVGLYVSFLTFAIDHGFGLKAFEGRHIRMLDLQWCRNIGVKRGNKKT
jgi:hypothetical protein